MNRRRPPKGSRPLLVAEPIPGTAVARCLCNREAYEVWIEPDGTIRRIVCRRCRSGSTVADGRLIVAQGDGRPNRK
jgi:hypothetical protein